MSLSFDDRRRRRPVCLTCRFYEPVGTPNQGVCHVNPPQVIATDEQGDYTAAQPETPADSFCRYHTPDLLD